MDFLPGTPRNLKHIALSLTHLENFQTLLQHPSITFLTTSTQQHLTAHLTYLRTAYIQPYLIQPLSTILVSTSSSGMPDLLSILLLALILLISLKILDYARRVIVFWVSLALRLTFWGLVIGGAWYVYSVGFENAGKDLGWAWGVIEGFVEDFQARSAAQVQTGGSGGRSSNVRSGWGSARKGYPGGYARGW